MIVAKFLKEQTQHISSLIFFSIVSVFPFKDALATTAFARQTGEPCSACHQQSYGPWLTPYGQKFKLDGYVAGHANKLPDVINPFALEVVGSVTNTQKDVPDGLYYSNQSGKIHSDPNNNAVNDWTALYYTGRVTDHIGSYLQLNLSPQTDRSLSLAMADIRYADHFNWNGNNLTYGVTVNNSPTMSDFWMTTYAWMYPYTQSAVTVAPNAQPWLQSLMEWANTAGATAYVMINNHLYLEAGGYSSQAKSMQQGLGVWRNSNESGQIVGGAPYWRAFLQHTVGPHTMMIGAYGLVANVIPQYVNGFGTDHYVEYNADANYSYMMDDDNMFMAMFRYAHDDYTMNASQAMGISRNTKNHLNNYMLMGMWTYKQTYNLAIGWNKTSGSADTSLYGSDPIVGSANGSPNSNAMLFEVDYVPFGKGTSVSDPYMNLRLSAQYWAYTQFNGGYRNYDGAGRNPEANNTLYFVGNLMF